LASDILFLAFIFYLSPGVVVGDLRPIPRPSSLFSPLRKNTGSVLTPTDCQILAAAQPASSPTIGVSSFFVNVLEYNLNDLHELPRGGACCGAFAHHPVLCSHQA
jgi:hypothetical protein